MQVRIMAGTTVITECLRCRISGTLQTVDVTSAVSDTGDKISPTHEPDTTAPATSPGGNPMPIPTPIIATPAVLTVPQLVPVGSAIRIQMIKATTRKIFGAIRFSPQ